MTRIQSKRYGIPYVDTIPRIEDGASIRCFQHGEFSHAMFCECTMLWVRAGERPRFLWGLLSLV